LLFRRGTPCFCAFDVLFLNGHDVRHLTLVERKRALRSIMPRTSKFLLCVDHVEGHGERLFQLVCDRDLEGVVAKHRHSRYSSEDGNPAWVKIRNRNYSQVIGRHELFEREPDAAYHAAMCWDSCTQACAQRANLS
jgi:ATP-dependent DNA ligase